MIKKFIKVGILWISLLFISVYWIYVLSGETWSLLVIDVKDLFSDNRNVFWSRVLPASVLITLFCVILLKKRRAYDYHITVTIGNRQKGFHVCGLKLFHKYMNLWVVLSLTAAVSCCLLGKAKTKELIYPDTKTIIHAMGMIEGAPYTNSLEAFEQHYANGQRYFEVDFSITSDGKMVARHDWGEGYQEGIDENHIPTEAEFLELPIFGKFTPLSLKNVISLMQKYPDMYVITDTKNTEPEPARADILRLYQTAVEMDAAEVLDRFVVQIYNVDMYEAIKDIYDFPHCIFTMYAVWNGNEEEFVRYCRFCRINNINTITMWDYRLADNPKLAAIAQKYDIKLYVHTVNDAEVAEKMFALGAAGIYTDDEAVINNR